MTQATAIQRETPEYQRAVSDMVRREVGHCVSGLVYTLAQGYTGGSSTIAADLMGLCEQAFELGAPVLDYQEAAEQAGWESYQDKFGVLCWKADDGATWAGDAEDLCREHDIEPYEWEVFEHWIVSDWLARKLEDRGERIDRDFARLTVWGRTTTGQGIASDSALSKLSTTKCGGPSTSRLGRGLG